MKRRMWLILAAAAVVGACADNAMEILGDAMVDAGHFLSDRDGEIAHAQPGHSCDTCRQVFTEIKRISFSGGADSGWFSLEGAREVVVHSGCDIDLHVWYRNANGDPEIYEEEFVRNVEMVRFVPDAAEMRLVADVAPDPCEVLVLSTTSGN